MLKQNQNIILASKSPRRQELLKGIGVSFSIETRDVDEVYDQSMDVYQVPEFLAKLKASPFLGEAYKDTVVVTSDTVVVHNMNILGKPKSREQAIEMLLKLSGDTHEVLTGVNIMLNGVSNSFSELTKVSFDQISTKEAELYIDNFKPFDKAGSYGIQEWLGFAKVSKLEGCYYNVMGLPLRSLYKKLLDLSIIEVQ